MSVTTGSKTPAWLVVWECGCSDVRVSQDSLPPTCPGHGRPPIERPERLDVLARFVDVHICHIEDTHAPECVAAGVAA